MLASKKLVKEKKILLAAEKVFGRLGFKNAKMEDIAEEADITKVTLYSYYQSKENLYMAITYRAMQFLNEEYYDTLDIHKNNSGLDSVIALTKTFMEFCEDNYLYSEALLDYFAMVRSTSLGQDQTKLTDATKESIYYRKLQDIHNLPFKLTVKEMQRGIADGSIRPNADPWFHTLHGWATAVGYAKVIAASGDTATPLFNVSLKTLKDYNIKVARDLLKNSED